MDFLENSMPRKLTPQARFQKETTILLYMTKKCLTYVTHGFLLLRNFMNKFTANRSALALHTVALTLLTLVSRNRLSVAKVVGMLVSDWA